jgi:hypothetical protein
MLVCIPLSTACLYLVPHPEEKTHGTQHTRDKYGIKILPPEEEKGDGDKDKAYDLEGTFHQGEV